MKPFKFSALSLILFAAFLIRLPLLTGSFWLDEAAQALESTRPLSAQFDIAADFQPPLYHLAVFALAGVSHAEWWLRLSSLIPSIAVVWLVYRISLRSQGESGSLVAAAVVGFSSLSVYFSQELRPYSLAVLWAVLSWWLLEKRSWRWLALAVSAGLYTSYVFLFWPLALLLLARSQKDLMKLTKSLSVSVLLFLAWLPGLLEQLRVGAVLRETLPTWEQAVSYTQAKALLLTAAKFLVGPAQIDFGLRDILTVGGMMVIFGIATVLLYMNVRRGERWHSVRAVLVFVAPLMAAWVFSFFIPVIQPKRLLYLLPAIGFFLGMLWESRTHYIGKLAVCLFFVWQAYSLFGYWTQPQWQRENWRLAIVTIEERFSSENTAIIFAFDAPFAPWMWYNREFFTTYATGLKPIEDVEQIAPTLQGIERFRYVIVFDYLRDLTDPYRVIDAYLGQREYRELGSLQYANIGPIRVFEQNRLYAGTANEPS